jgi:hypothetical protein
MEDKIKSELSQIPLCTISAGPRDKEWENRLKEEYNALIAV